MDRPDVISLFSRQHAVASVRQLALLGISRSALSRACAAGAIERVHLGVYRLAGAPPDFLGTALAIQLLAGHTAFLSGRTAGAIHGLRGMPRHPIEVSVREWHQPRIPAPHRVVRTTWDSETRDVETRPDGIRVTTPLRTMFDLARCCNDHRFERAAEDLWHRGLVTPEQAADYLATVRRRGRTGVGRVARWLDGIGTMPRPAQSGLELDLLAMIERVGLPSPVRQHPLRLLSGETVHLDIAWPDIRLAVEPGHSWWHGGDLRQRADQARDRACALVGWHVHRYDETATKDHGATARELLALYRRRVADIGRSL
ncbi:MAG TPA: type IV toxin-antitoxin system AbiEi family antitoxin domain-containing protein [Ilumatobacteraceae bacterium]|nr:type IV toxin-antitoxin system AbiEi family antitoxin domain-containing protein [Ilumatobacteraceae bacterium]